ncbi:hypothetical protein [Streptomyces griseoaurantiacus]|uniref:hypothetical protein n=1 Tax=Streptomyces griseoaurantiacus TaxID=68213 RepID=UPI003677F684
MVLAEGEDVDARRVGEHRFLDELPYGGGLCDESAGPVLRHVAERVEAELDVGHGLCSFTGRRAGGRALRTSHPDNYPDVPRQVKRIPIRLARVSG